MERAAAKLHGSDGRIGLGWDRMAHEEQVRGGLEHDEIGRIKKACFGIVVVGHVAVGRRLLGVDNHGTVAIEGEGPFDDDGERAVGGTNLPGDGERRKGRGVQDRNLRLLASWKRGDTHSVNAEARTKRGQTRTPIAKASC